MIRNSEVRWKYWRLRTGFELTISLTLLVRSYQTSPVYTDAIQRLVFELGYLYTRPSLWAMLILMPARAILSLVRHFPHHLFVRLILSAKSKWCVEWDSKLCAKESKPKLEHLSQSKISWKHLLLLKIKSPRQLGITGEHTRMWSATASLWRPRSRLHGGRDQASGLRKVNEKNMARMHPWVVTHRFLNIDVGPKWEPKL